MSAEIAAFDPQAKNGTLLERLTQRAARHPPSLDGGS